MTTVLTLGAVVVGVAPARAADPTSTLRLDAGCNRSVLGRGAVISPANDNRYFLSGAVTGLTPGLPYLYDWPAPGVADGATEADLGTADAAGTVRVDRVLLQPPNATYAQFVDYEIRQGRADGFGNPTGPIVATGTQTVAVLPNSACSVLGLLRVAEADNSGAVLVQQTDGNVVLRLYPAAGSPRALWSNGAVGHPGAATVLQSDGNLVTRDRSGRALWSTGTAGHPGASLTLQTDHNLVVRDAQGRALWSIGARR